MNITNLGDFKAFCGDGIELEWQGDDLLAIGPLGTKLYKRIEPTKEWQQEVKADEFYVSDNHPEYDLYLLRDRIIGDLLQPEPSRPLGGHAAEVAEGATWAGYTELRTRDAIIEGACYESHSTGLNLVFGRYGFRGAGSRYSDRMEPFCSCSGGPCPHDEPIGDFQFSGKYVERKFWRWRDSAKGHGGEHYYLQVPLWIWTPSR